MKDMDAGKKTKLSELTASVRHAQALAIRAGSFGQSGSIPGAPSQSDTAPVDSVARATSAPHQVGDYGEPDETGREVQYIRIRDLLIAFWPDDAVKEIRIVDIEEI